MMSYCTLRQDRVGYGAVERPDLVQRGVHALKLGQMVFFCNTDKNSVC